MHYEVNHEVGTYSNARGFSADHDRNYETPKRALVANRWLLATIYYDFEALTWSSGGRLYINDGVDLLDSSDTQTNQVNNRSYGSMSPWIPTAASDITADEVPISGVGLQPHRLTFGRNGRRDFVSRPEWGGHSWDSPCYATLDEIAVYDFGRDPLCTKVLAERRFKEGRYYKGSAYTRLNDLYIADQAGAFFTAPIQLPPGSLLRKVAWTWYRPEELPDDYAEIELAEPSGNAYLAETGADGSAKTRSTRSLGWTADRQEWDPAKRVPGPFRAHVVFRRKDGSATVDADTPILDSPVFDDLTLLYEPPEAARFRGWETRGE